MSRLHVCVDLSLDPSGRLIVIGLLDCCTFFTIVPGRKTFPVTPASDMAYLLVLLMINVEYAVSIFLFYRLLMILIFFIVAIGIGGF